jgi:hypothetical protein
VNLHAVAKNYRSLTPEERFRLIFAALGRGDEAEAERLKYAAGRITVSQQDHAPFVLAFAELSWFAYIELADAAAVALHAFEIVSLSDADRKLAGGLTPAELKSVAALMLRTKVDGWKLFCQRLNVPPFLLWEAFPGLERLQRALAKSQEFAFTKEDMLRWLNTLRPVGRPKMTQLLFTAEGVADAHESTFRQRAEWFGAPT